MVDKILKFLRNESLLSSYDAAYAKLNEILATKTDGEIALASYGDSWENAKTIFGLVREKNGQKSTTIYAPFKNADIEIGSGLVLGDDGKIAVKADNTTLGFAEDGTLKVNGENVTLKINSNDKVLTQDATNGIMTNLSLNYDTNSKKIQIIGKNNAVVTELDATNFIKDGMLDKAELVVVDDKHKVDGVDNGTYIKLTWNTDGGKTEPMYINVTSLIDIYTAGDGVNVSDTNVISVKLADGNEAFLSVDENGLKLSGVQTAINTAVSEILKDYQTTTYSEPFETKVANFHVNANDSVKDATKKIENTISTLVDEVIANEETVASAINDVANATGIVGNDGKIGYNADSTTEYIKNATSLHNATVILDGKIKEILTDNVINGGTY